MLTQDLVGVCLLLVKGDASACLGDVIQAAEQFQQANDRHFGVSTADFRSLFAMLVFLELGLRGNIEDRLQDMTLQASIPNMLAYQDVYFNDEGEHWNRHDVTEPDFIASVYGYSEERYQRKTAIKKAMRAFFADGARAPSIDDVRDFMAHHDVRPELLMRHQGHQVVCESGMQGW